MTSSQSECARLSLEGAGMTRPQAEALLRILAAKHDQLFTRDDARQLARGINLRLGVALGVWAGFLIALQALLGLS